MGGHVTSADRLVDHLVRERRRRDHDRIDKVLVSGWLPRMTSRPQPGASLLERLLTPLNRLGSQRFLRAARQKVWHNTLELQASRLAGPKEYVVRRTELEPLSAANIANLLQPSQVLLRLAAAGFPVILPPPNSEAIGPRRSGAAS